jgi:hypothetical protein
MQYLTRRMGASWTGIPLRVLMLVGVFEVGFESRSSNVVEAIDGTC